MTDPVHEMPKAFEPGKVEAHWYQFWLENGFFSASTTPEDIRPVYTIQMPPPNVTGSLHMGHAMRAAFEDTLTRWHRMRGFNTLWQPGIDHAGIATQMVVEKQLAREGTNRYTLGRDAFLERVWAWKAQSGGQIALQQRELGASPDWPRSVFTMDPSYAKAVREAFVQLYQDGLIYRATRLVNWDVEARTVLSDLEVENEEGANGELFEFAYQIADGEGEIVVATTRPETMLGDTAVAVHPDDPRYQHLIGKKLRHPFVDRQVPIIADPILVDMKFGTGAVKVTPAHDFNDFATGKRHRLEEISIFTLDGKVNEQGGLFAGLDRFEARRAVKKKLAELGLARGSKPHTLTLPRSQRNGSIVEPMISTQWFVKMKPMAEKALAAVAEGRTKILPVEWTKTYNHFLENIQDWCISRQLWWGHRVPAFHCKTCGTIEVTRADSVSTCPSCSSSEIHQDDDVLDTWFSSGIWPFATLGWPEKTPELARFYPGSDLETGYDILFFWVARMMMMGLHFMGEVPFRRVLLAGLLVDETGKKMSKTIGNVIDPLDLIHGATFESVVQKASPGVPLKDAQEKFAKSYPSTTKMGTGFPEFGTDALRMMLTSYSPSSTRIALAPKRIEGYRHFCNKLWNATRFALPYLDGFTPSHEIPTATSLANRWILHRLAVVAQQAHDFIDNYRLDEALQSLYHFFWNDLCDWFLELTKPVFSGPENTERRETQAVLAHALDHAFRLLHPFAPFVTEDLWQRLPHLEDAPKSLCIARYTSTADGRLDEQAHKEMTALQTVIGAARTIRSEHEVTPKAVVPVRLRSSDAALRELLQRESIAIQTLVKTEGAPVIESSGDRPRGYVLDVAGDIEVLVGLAGHVDAGKERDRIERNLKKIAKELEGLQKRLNLPSFVNSAPPEVVAETRAQVAALQKSQTHLEASRGLVDELSDPIPISLKCKNFIAKASSNPSKRVSSERTPSRTPPVSSAAASRLLRSWGLVAPRWSRLSL